MNVIDELDAIVRECSEPNWNGDGAVPVTDKTAEMVRRILQALPSDLPHPSSFAGEPDGDIGFEWYTNTQCVLSVSVRDDGTIYYAALIGNDSPRGRLDFD